MDLRSVKSTDHRKSFWLSLVLDKFPNSEPDYVLSLPSSDLERFICFHPSWENSVLIVTTLSISIYQRIFIMGIMGTPTQGGCRRNLWRISRSSLQLQNGLTVQWIQSIQWIWWIDLSMLFRPKPKTLSQVFSNALCRCISHCLCLYSMNYTCLWTDLRKSWYSYHIPDLWEMVCC